MRDQVVAVGVDGFELRRVGADGDGFLEDLGVGLDRVDQLACRDRVGRGRVRDDAIAEAVGGVGVLRDRGLAVTGLLVLDQTVLGVPAITLDAVRRAGFEQVAVEVVAVRGRFGRAGRASVRRGRGRFGQQPIIGVVRVRDGLATRRGAGECTDAVLLRLGLTVADLVVRPRGRAIVAVDAGVVTDRPKGATDDRRNGATLGWLKRDSNGVSGCGVFGVLCNR